MSLKGLVRDYKTHGLQPVQTQEAMVYVMATFDQYRSMDASRRGYWRQSCFRFVRSLFRPTQLRRPGQNQPWVAVQ